MKLDISYQDIISLDNLLSAWQEFLRGKRKRKDVQEFSLNLMDNITALHGDLFHHTYKHGGYQAFNISDPKPRNIHKAGVRDRLLHHAVYRRLYPFFDKRFIPDSYSCRLKKGTHRAIDRFRSFARAASENNTRTCWILKCDIRKFFASIDHSILENILAEYIEDKNTLWLLNGVIGSFSSPPTPLLIRRGEGAERRGEVLSGEVGLPLGNLTSQLLVNIYMNEFDQFVKHELKIKHYIRYADDFVIFSPDKECLENLVKKMGNFLKSKLRLDLHPNKIFLKTLNSGVDFLGWVNFFDHRILRTTAKRRMLKRTRKHPSRATIDSYLGLLKHGNARRLRDELLNLKLS